MARDWQPHKVTDNAPQWTASKLMAIDDPERLWAIWERHRATPRRMAAIWFPAKPAGYCKAAQDLANLACNRAVALRCERRFDTESARIYHDITKNIVDVLPDFAR